MSVLFKCSQGTSCLNVTFRTGPWTTESPLSCLVPRRRVFLLAGSLKFELSRSKRDHDGPVPRKPVTLRVGCSDAARNKTLNEAPALMQCGTFGTCLTAGRTGIGLQPRVSTRQRALSVKSASATDAHLLNSNFKDGEPATLGGTYSDAPRLTIGRKQSGSTHDAASSLPRFESTAVPALSLSGKTLSIELGGGGTRQTRPSPGWLCGCRRATPKRVTFTQEKQPLQVQILPVQFGAQVLLLLLFSPASSRGDLLFLLFFLFLLRVAAALPAEHEPRADR